MTDRPFTLIDDGRPVEVPVTVHGETVRLPVAAVAAALAVTWPGGAASGAVELRQLAALLDRPVAMDPAERVAYLGISARARGQTLASLRAPGFTLPDLAGRPHSLGDYRGRKVLVVAYGSW